MDYRCTTVVLVAQFVFLLQRGQSDIGNRHTHIDVTERPTAIHLSAIYCRRGWPNDEHQVDAVTRCKSWFDTSLRLNDRLID